MPCLLKVTGNWSPFLVSWVWPDLVAQFGVLEPILLSSLESALSPELMTCGSPLHEALSVHWRGGLRGLALSVLVAEPFNGLAYQSSGCLFF